MGKWNGLFSVGAVHWRSKKNTTDGWARKSLQSTCLGDTDWPDASRQRQRCIIDESERSLSQQGKRPSFMLRPAIDNENIEISSICFDLTLIDASNRFRLPFRSLQNIAPVGVKVICVRAAAIHVPSERTMYASSWRVEQGKHQTAGPPTRTMINKQQL